MRIIMRLLFAFILCSVLGCDESEDCPPVLAESHSGWKDSDCITCHTDPAYDSLIPHDVVPIPECASCHGANGACARPQVTWHPAESCADYNCHGAMHSFTDPSDCGNCHSAEKGVFQCSTYH
jgi:hypothetical protein